MFRVIVTRILVCAALAVMPLAVATADEEEKKLGWSDSAELSYVVTSGNSETSTLGFKNKTTRTWESSDLVIRLGGITAETTVKTRTALGDPDDFVVETTEVTEKTAEAYYLGGRYGHDITERFFWYAGLSWNRNRFAGIEDRYLAEAGVGNTWWDRGDLQFRTLYAATYTDQEDVIVDPTRDESFGGLRFSWDYLNKFGKATTYENVFIFDYNTSDSDDWRADMVNSLAVAMTERLALKASLTWLYRNSPSLTNVVLENPPGTPIGVVAVPLDELDSIFNLSLVVNF